MRIPKSVLDAADGSPMGGGQIVGLIHMFVCEQKKMSVRGRLEKEKGESSEDFYQYHQQRECKQKRRNCGAKQ